MLPQGDKPARRVSQACAKLTKCHAGCGADVEYRTNPKVTCEACRPVRKLESARAAMTLQRRKRGVSVVKGTSAVCERCGDGYERIVLRSKYCSACKFEVPRERARAASLGKKGVPGAYVAQARWYREKRHSTSSYAINFRFRAAIRRTIDRKKAGRKWEVLVGYTLFDLMRHLERQFLPGMSWENREKWHIDHIVPLSSFKFATPECDGFKAAWALSNLRPLWGVDNVRKGAARTYLI